MNAVEVLRNEHKLILRFLSDLDDALTSMEWQKEKGPPAEYFRQAIRFARDFADKYHHHKEEHIMFTLLAQKHSGEIDAQVERLRQQHESGRDLLTEAESAINGYERGEEASARHLHYNLLHYMQNLRAHIREENEEFFPLVEKSTSAEEARALAQEFARTDGKFGTDFQKMNESLLTRMSTWIT